MGPVSSFVDFNPLGFLQKLVCMIKKYSTQTFPKPGSVFATTTKMRRIGQKVSKEEEELKKEGQNKLEKGEWGTAEINNKREWYGRKKK